MADHQGPSAVDPHVKTIADEETTKQNLQVAAHLESTHENNHEQLACERNLHENDAIAIRQEAKINLLQARLDHAHEIKELTKKFNDEINELKEALHRERLEHVAEIQALKEALHRERLEHAAEIQALKDEFHNYTTRQMSAQLTQQAQPMADLGLGHANTRIREQQNSVWLPRELAMLVGSYLDPHDLQMCTTQLCSSGVECVSIGFRNDTTTIRLHELVACCRLSPGEDDVAQECMKRIESFVKRRGNVQTIILDAQLKGERAANAGVYSGIHRRLQQGSSFQLSQNQGITIEWHVTAESIAQVEFLLKVDVPTDGARESDSSAGGGATRQYLHTLDLSETQVSDVSVLASCKSLHTLNLNNTQVSDVSALAACQSLHTLYLEKTQVSDVSALAACQSLHTLNLRSSQVSDVTALASCPSLHTLILRETQVSDVSALGLCQSLHTLDLQYTQVSDVSALASCPSLHALYLERTQVSDVSALASSQSLHDLDLNLTQVSDVSVLTSCLSLHRLDLAGAPVTDVSALAFCHSLHTLNLTYTQVVDVSALASCQSLHTLFIHSTPVSDVSALASSRSLHVLDLSETQVSDVSALGSSQSLHTMYLKGTEVTDVTALASCQSLRKLDGAVGMVGCPEVLWIIQGRDLQH
jgi:Leucine-rich repeat (LRR) protein